MPSKKPDQKKHGGLTAGLLAGAALGVATALYLQTPKGKNLLRDADKKAKTLQKRVLAESKKMKTMTRKNYDAVVSKVLDYHAASKDISEHELPEVKRFLLDKWADIQSELKKKPIAKKKSVTKTKKR